MIEGSPFDWLKVAFYKIIRSVSHISNLVDNDLIEDVHFRGHPSYYPWKMIWTDVLLRSNFDMPDDVISRADCNASFTSDT